jgi:large subunit ribosomal protein L32
LTAANPNECPQCHYPKAQHRICTNCGYYNGRPVRPSGGDE